MNFMLIKIMIYANIFNAKKLNFIVGKFSRNKINLKLLALADSVERTVRVYDY